MTISKIIYYTREGDKSKTISLRELGLNKDVEFEALFSAIKDVEDSQDLLVRFRRLSCDTIEYDHETDSYIRFTVVDARGQKNYLKFRIRKEN